MTVYHPPKPHQDWQSQHDQYGYADAYYYDDDNDNDNDDEFAYDSDEAADYDYDERELVPYTNDTLWMRMPIILGLVTLVMIGLFWIPMRGISALKNIDLAADPVSNTQAKPNENNQTQLAALPMPTPTLAPAGTSGSQVERVATPPPSMVSEVSLNREFVTAKMEGDLGGLLGINFPPRNYLETHLELTTLSRPTVDQRRYWQQGQLRTINVMGDPVQMRLAAAGNNAYIWVDTRLSISDAAFAPVVQRLDYELYPAMTKMFGVEARSGHDIDNDDRFHIFHIARLDSKELGYFDSSDVYPTEIFAESNENEAIYINMDTMEVGENVYYGTLVHELQHLIRWNVDKNETTWLDEGLSQLSEIYTGFNSFTVNDFIRNNDIQLNRWSYEDQDLYSHYGASALFTVYLWEQFGDGFIQYLAASPYDGMSAVEDALNWANAPSLETVMRDWMIAVYLNDPNVKEAQYGFSRYEFNPPLPHQVALVNNKPLKGSNDRKQYSAWYVDLPSNQEVSISFVGDSVQELFDEPLAGKESQVFYAPPRNRIASTLSKRIDLRGATSATLKFDAWYQMEEGFDYVYVMVSADGGNSWGPLEFVDMAQGTYGPGFTGHSAGWQTYSTNLSMFRGYEIIVRFLVLTDSAYPLNGFAVDNVQVTGQDMSSFEAHADGWTADGFMLSGHLIPQQWTVAIVDQKENQPPQITDLKVSPWAEANLTYQAEGEAMLLISPMSPFTTNEASFELEIR